VQKKKLILSGFFIILVFTIIGYLSLSSFTKEFNFLDMERTEATIYTTYSKKGTFTLPNYYAIVEKSDGAMSYERHRITQNQINTLDNSDKIFGFKTVDGGFSSTKDVIHFTIISLALVVFSGVILLFGIAVIYLQLPFVKKSKSEIRSFLMFILKWFLGLPFALFILLQLSQFAGNVYYTLIPMNQSEADAVIASKESSTSSGRYKTVSYEFSLEFEDQSGDSIDVYKRVPKKTYDDYHEGGTISIAYRDKNPYDIYLLRNDQFTIKNLFYFSPNMVYLYSIIFVVVIINGRNFLKKLYKHFFG